MPIGNLQNVFPIIEELKEKIEHSNPISPDALKWIQDYKRDKKSLYHGAPLPDRTVALMKEGFKELKP